MPPKNGNPPRPQRQQRPPRVKAATPRTHLLAHAGANLSDISVDDIKLDVTAAETPEIPRPKRSGIMVTASAFLGSIWNLASTAEFAKGNNVNDYHENYNATYTKGCNDALSSAGQYNNQYPQQDFSQAGSGWLCVLETVPVVAASMGGGYLIGNSFEDFYNGNFSTGACKFVTGAGLVCGSALLSMTAATSNPTVLGNRPDAANWQGYETGFAVCCQQVPNHGCATNPSISFASNDKTNSPAEVLRVMDMPRKAVVAGGTALALGALGLFAGCRDTVRNIRYGKAVAPREAMELKATIAKPAAVNDSAPAVVTPAGLAVIAEGTNESGTASTNSSEGAQPAP